MIDQVNHKTTLQVAFELKYKYFNSNATCVKRLGARIGVGYNKV